MFSISSFLFINFRIQIPSYLPNHLYIFYLQSGEQLGQWFGYDVILCIAVEENPSNSLMTSSSGPLGMIFAGSKDVIIGWKLDSEVSYYSSFLSTGRVPHSYILYYWNRDLKNQISYQKAIAEMYQLCIYYQINRLSLAPVWIKRYVNGMLRYL